MNSLPSGTGGGPPRYPPPVLNSFRPHHRARVAGIATAACTAIAALLPTSFVDPQSGLEYKCGPALTATVHRFPGCQDTTPPYLIAAVLIAAAGSIYTLKVSSRNAPPQHYPPGPWPRA